jgi:hypothetical protein
MERMKIEQVAGVALLVVLALSSGSAQTASQGGSQAKQEPATRPAPEPLGLSTNIRLDVTITDQTGPGDPMKKTVTMVMVDRANGSIRSTGVVRDQGRVQINVDAAPMLLPNGGIRVRLGLEYNPRTAGAEGPTESSSLNEQITVVLEPGKPMVVSQSADPASDRKISVELRASLLK